VERNQERIDEQSGEENAGFVHVKIAIADWLAKQGACFPLRADWLPSTNKLPAGTGGTWTPAAPHWTD
jgi:hypothetical protein